MARQPGPVSGGSDERGAISSLEDALGVGGSSIANLGALPKGGAVVERLWVGDDIGSDNSTYTTKGRMHWNGTVLLGSPVSLHAIVYCAGVGDVRLYDVTNSKVIAEMIGVSGAVPTLSVFPTIANLPTAMAMFEIQFRITSGIDKIKLDDLVFHY